MLSLGDTLHGRYRVDRLMEIGAQEARYVGWDLQEGAAVTISELMPQPDLDQGPLDELIKAFEVEADALSRLQHPGIIPPADFFCLQATDLGQSDAQVNAYLVRPASAGQTLAEVLEQRGTVTEDEAIQWATQLLEALAYAHRQGICHGNLVPDHIFISSDGSAALTDFELLALWSPSDPRTWTAKRVMGTPEYLPPERWGVRQDRAEPTGDIYSLGACLYHAITGEQPITAGERTSNPYHFLQVKALSPKVSGRAKAAVLKAMSLAPDKRFATAGEMARALQTAEPQDTNTGAAPPPAIMLARFGRRSRHRIGLWGWLGSVLGLSLAAATGLALGPAWRHPTGDAATGPPTAIATSRPTSAVAPGGAAPELVEAPAGEAPSEVDQPTAPLGGKTEAGAAPEVDSERATPEPGSILDTLAPTPPSGWEQLVSDPFDDNENQWLVSEHEDDWGTIARAMAVGSYRWTVTADQAVGRWCTPELDGRDATVGDFYVSVDVQRETGPVTAAYGVILRLSDGDYYQFSVRDDGYYQFSLWYGYAWQPIIDWTSTDLVVPGEPNRLTAIAEADRFEFYINDEFADKATDTRLPRGEAGLSISTAATDGDAVFVFDDFELWRPQS